MRVRTPPSWNRHCPPGPPEHVRGRRAAAGFANLSFLVERERREEFLAAVHRLSEEHTHLLVQVAGPLPAYSFTEEG